MLLIEDAHCWTLSHEDLAAIFKVAIQEAGAESLTVATLLHVTISRYVLNELKGNYKARFDELGPSAVALAFRLTSLAIEGVESEVSRLWEDERPLLTMDDDPILDELLKLGPAQTVCGGGKK